MGTPLSNFDSRSTGKTLKKGNFNFAKDKSKARQIWWPPQC